jgi:HEAT repeat protein
VICRTLGQLRKPEAREAILASIEDDDNLVRAEACRALGKVGRTQDSTVLARVMTVDVAVDCRVAAIESLGELKAKDRRINEFLVTGMEHEEPAIRVASMNALKSITGKDLGVDPLAWKKYVESLPDDKPAAGSAPPSPSPTPPPRLPAGPAPPDDGIR